MVPITPITYSTVASSQHRIGILFCHVRHKNVVVSARLCATLAELEERAYGTTEPATVASNSDQE